MASPRGPGLERRTGRRMWGTQFGTLPKLDPFIAYAERLSQREAFRRGKEEDNQLIAEMQAAG